MESLASAHFLLLLEGLELPEPELTTTEAMIELAMRIDRIPKTTLWLGANSDQACELGSLKVSSWGRSFCCRKSLR